MPNAELPVQGVVFKIEQAIGEPVKVSWWFQQKEYSVTGANLAEAVENGTMAVQALIRQGGLI
jgi:hypothetical protein